MAPKERPASARPSADSAAKPISARVSLSESSEDEDLEDFGDEDTRDDLLFGMAVAKNGFKSRIVHIERGVASRVKLYLVRPIRDTILPSSVWLRLPPGRAQPS